MTDATYTALLLVVDRSGSMTDIRLDMIEGLGSLLADQAAQDGLLTVDWVQFDDQIEHVHRLADPRSVRVALDPRGSTALFDAIGLGVTAFGAELAALPEHARPGTVQVAIVTDGFENASREYTVGAVRELIRHQAEVYGWSFVFLGANQDAVLTAEGLGIAADAALTFEASGVAVGSASAAMSRHLSSVRHGDVSGFTGEERMAAAPPRGSR